MTSFDKLAGEIVVLYGGRSGGGSLCALEMARALESFAPARALLAEGNEHLQLWRSANLAFRTLPTYGGAAGFAWHSLTPSRPRQWGNALAECRRKIVLEAMPSPWSARLRRGSNARLRWVPVIHDAEIHPGILRPWIARIQREIIGSGFATAAMSKYCAGILTREWGVASGRIIQLRHGMLQRPETRLSPAERSRLRHRLLFFGRVEPYKGLDILAKAFGAAKSLMPELCLTVAGRGNLGPLRESFSGQAGITCLNRYLPEEEVAGLFSSHGVCVLPYTQATQSGVMALALGHGVPAIASRVGGLPEQVLDGKTGLLVTPGDAGELSRAILAMAQSEDAAARLAAGTAEFADREFSWAGIMREFLSQLRDILERDSNFANAS